MGFGTYIWNNKSAYVGHWNGGNIEGRGLITHSVRVQRSYAHRGDNTNVECHPNARLVSFSDCTGRDSCVRMYLCGDTYYGDFANGLRSGYGCYKFVGGDVYEGNFSDGQCHGLGVKYMSNGDVYDGEWYNGKAHGYGVKTFHFCGDSYRGNHENDERHGYGVYRWFNGHEYEGDFEHDQLSGIGHYHWNKSASYQGEWNEGLRSGPGVLRVQIRGLDLFFFEMWSNGKRLHRSRIINCDSIPSINQLRTQRRLLFAIKTLGKRNTE